MMEIILSGNSKLNTSLGGVMNLKKMPMNQWTKTIRVKKKEK